MQHGHRPLLRLRLHLGLPVQQGLESDALVSLQPRLQDNASQMLPARLLDLPASGGSAPPERGELKRQACALTLSLGLVRHRRIQNGLQAIEAELQILGMQTAKERSDMKRRSQAAFLSAIAVASWSCMLRYKGRNKSIKPRVTWVPCRPGSRKPPSQGD